MLKEPFSHFFKDVGNKSLTHSLIMRMWPEPSPTLVSSQLKNELGSLYGAYSETQMPQGTKILPKLDSPQHSQSI